jgi:CheY-like chemotaxis protein
MEMTNILIVDDNKNNRMILNLLLEDYLDENSGIEFNIEEAANGQIAVDMCREQRFDLVFMDIMMPEMNGIEATKIIREEDKNVMIIAVSAIDDAERKREILNNGAEDYITKPVNSDIFQSRIGNYLSIIDSRQHKKYNADATNLYTREVFNRRLIFMIRSEDALSELWEYYLLKEGERAELLSDVVRVIYALCDLQLKLDVKSEVVVEESETHHYFTLSDIDQLDVKLIKLVLLKNKSVKDYKIEGDKISFKLETVEEIETVEPLVEQVVVKTTVEPEPVAAPVEIQIETSATEHHVFAYIDEDDLDEIELYLGKLSSLLLLVGSSDVEDDEIVEIYTYLDRLSKILATYSESFRISGALQDLSVVISEEIENFRINSTALGPMATAFSNDLIKWNKMVFHEGAPSVNFLDDTICANAQMIGSMLRVQEEPESLDDNLDDIFDF